MDTFDLTKVPADQLVAFYGLFFAAAAADGTTDKEELLAIYETIDLSPLTEKQKEKVRGFVINVPSVSSCLDELAGAVDELRYAVAVGVIEVLFADDVITEEENAFLGEVCTRLHVTEKQRNAIITFVHEARRIREEGVDNNAAEKAIKSAASGLTAVLQRLCNRTKRGRNHVWPGRLGAWIGDGSRNWHRGFDRDGRVLEDQVSARR
jgi:hypothetical protein